MATYFGCAVSETSHTSDVIKSADVAPASGMVMFSSPFTNSVRTASWAALTLSGLNGCPTPTICSTLACKASGTQRPIIRKARTVKPISAVISLQGTLFCPETSRNKKRQHSNRRIQHLLRLEAEKFIVVATTAAYMIPALLMCLSCCNQRT